MGHDKTIFEINTRVFLKRFKIEGREATIADIPESYWSSLSQKGIGYIWLMGVWETSAAIIAKCCFETGLIQSYSRALKDWTREDVIGSPYAITRYSVNHNIGSFKDLETLRETLHRNGLQLLLDFIPNHFSAATAYLDSQPEVFLQCSEERFREDPHTIFKHGTETIKYFAHGRDPFFPAWTDTVQVNYCSYEARKFMKERLNEIAGLCDGVRCDMAMLPLNNVFQNTWGGLLSENGFSSPISEFWFDAIAEVKNNFPGFLFIAEAYWDLEWKLQQLGFDYTYDKKLYDRLKHDKVSSILGHLKADMEFQAKTVRFIENHDEERAMHAFGKDKSLASALLILTIPGITLLHDGQFEGKKVKLPVQLGREPQEFANQLLYELYNKLLKLCDSEIIHQGEWFLMEPITSWPGNYRFEDILAYEWRFHEHHLLIVLNYASQISQCRLQLNLEGYDENFALKDLWSGIEYRRSSEDARREGLYIELAPWHFHMFLY